MKNEPCAYCGENKWENREKHLAELSEFLQKAAATLGSLGGSKKTPAKSEASRLNGKKGGRPRNKTR